MTFDELDLAIQNYEKIKRTVRPLSTQKLTDLLSQALQFKAMEVLEGSLQQVGVGELAILTNGFQLFRSSTAMFEQLTKLREFAKGNKARLAAEEFDKFCAKVTNEGFDVASLSFAELDVCVSEMKDMDEDKSVKMVSLVPVVLRALKHQARNWAAL